MAFLIIVALLVPIGNDINKLTRLPLLPSATSMIVPPAVSSAAFEVSLMAQLPPNSKVLVMFDYDATQAGELNRVAQRLSARARPCATRRSKSPVSMHRAAHWRKRC